jgi:formate transporter
MDVDALLPPDVARRAEDVGVAKVTMPTESLFVLAVLAGAFITLGAVFSTVVTAGGGLAPGPARLLGGLVFSLGLVLVVVAGAELFTGNALVAIATASRRVRVRALLRNWLIVYVGNFVGALLTTVGVVWSGIYERADGAVGVRALDIAAAKTSLAADEAVILGVFANALVCLAVWLSLSARSVTDKILAVTFPVTAFVAAGFEHSIANMYFIPAGLFSGRGHRPASGRPPEPVPATTPRSRGRTSSSGTCSRSPSATSWVGPCSLASSTGSCTGGAACTTRRSSRRLGTAIVPMPRWVGKPTDDAPHGAVSGAAKVGPHARAGCA